MNDYHKNKQENIRPDKEALRKTRDTNVSLHGESSNRPAGEDEGDRGAAARAGARGDVPAANGYMEILQDGKGYKALVLRQAGRHDKRERNSGMEAVESDNRDIQEEDRKNIRGAGQEIREDRGDRHW